MAIDGIKILESDFGIDIHNEILDLYDTQKSEQEINILEWKQKYTNVHTMFIVHKGFRCFRATSSTSILGCNLMGLNPEIQYNTIHSTLAFIEKKATTQIKQKNKMNINH
jgi:hypothetical protein